MNGIRKVCHPRPNEATGFRQGKDSRQTLLRLRSPSGCRSRLHRIALKVSNLQWTNRQLLQFGLNFRPISRGYHNRLFRVDVLGGYPLYIFRGHSFDLPGQLLVVVRRQVVGEQVTQCGGGLLSGFKQSRK